MSKPRAVVRTITDGRVKVYDRYFYPNEKYMEYDGRLDGRRYWFGIYYDYIAGIEQPRMTNMISLIREAGSPVRFDPDNPASYSENRPEVVGDSVPWLFWFTDEN